MGDRDQGRYRQVLDWYDVQQRVGELAVLRAKPQAWEAARASCYGAGRAGSSKPRDRVECRKGLYESSLVQAMYLPS